MLDVIADHVEANCDVDMKNIETSNISDTEGNDSDKHNDDEINPVTLCANCLKSCDTKQDECFERDFCDHLLCINCRFTQDNICKLCKTDQKEDANDSVALDLSMDLPSTDNDPYKSGVFQRKLRVRRYILPNYIDVLPRNQYGETSYRCSICKKTFFYRLQAKYHEACFTGHRPLKCDQCDKTFIKKSHLQYHLNTHSGIKPFKCDVCGKGFIQKSKLNRHVIAVHSGAIKPFSCEICDVAFSTKQTLEQHLRIHSGDRPYNCKHCRRKFSSKSSLTKHEVRHSGVKNFICEECGKRFVLKQNLVAHRRWHSDVRPHACNICGLAFVERKDLLRHVQIHSDTERDFECSICIMAFRRKDNLERHMRNIHPETVTKYGRPQHIVSVVKVDNNLQFNKEKHKIPATTVEVKNNACVLRAQNNCIDNQRNERSNTWHHPEVASEDGFIKNVRSDVDEEIKEDRSKALENNVIMSNTICNNFGEPYRSTSSHVKDKFVDLSLKSSSEEPKTDSHILEKSLKTSAPKYQTVSVINTTKNFISDASGSSKNSQLVNDIHKRTDTLAPYRLITPPQDSKNVNCVPTITKVTHIVHTSDTGVSNIKTLITTRNAPDKSANRTKPKRSSTVSVDKQNQQQQNNSVNNSGGVIKYVSRDISKSSTESKHRCYRILESNSNQSFTTLSSNNIVINNAAINLTSNQKVPSKIPP